MRDSAPSPSQTLLFALGLEAGTAPPCRLPAFLPSFVETGTRGWGEGGVDMVQKARETTGCGSAGPRRRAETHAGCLAAVPSQRGLTRGSGGGPSRFRPVLLRTGTTPQTRPRGHVWLSPALVTSRFRFTADSLFWASLASGVSRGNGVLSPPPPPRPPRARSADPRGGHRTATRGTRPRHSRSTRFSSTAK